jgi:PHD/YefM family antitoxin component YafN of YafNO toxin-antitoxin module
MKTMTTAEAKNSFDQFLDLALREPMLVTRRNMPVGVFLSARDLEDMMLGERALRAHAEGYLRLEESKKHIDEFLS